MTHEEHCQRHIELHHALDELLADWLAQTSALTNSSTVKELMDWSNRQCSYPTPNTVIGPAAHSGIQSRPIKR